MNRLCHWVCAASAVMALTAAEGSAQPTSVMVEPGVRTDIATGGPAGIAPGFAQPLHGSLTALGNVLIYHPAPSFWSVGADLVTFTPFGIGAQPVHVFLVAQDLGKAWLSADFETTIELPPELRIEGDSSRAQRTGDAAIGGEMGLALVAGAGDVYAAIEPGEPGGANQGSGGKSGVDPPWPPGSSLSLFGERGWRLMGFGSFAEVELRMRPAATGYEVLMRHTDDPLAEDPSHTWLFVGQGPHRYEVRLWAKAEPLSVMIEGAYQLRVDGVVVDERGLIATAKWPDKKIQVGLVDVPAGVTTSLEIDDVEAWDQPWQPGRTLLRGEPFENGVPADLTLSSPGAISTVASKISTGDALIAVPGAFGGWARDALPAATALAGVRFSLRTADLTLGAGSSVSLLELGDADGGGTSLAALWLARDAAGDTLTLEIRDDNGVLSAGPPIAIDGNGTIVELRWEAASGDAVPTGQAALYVGGVEQSRLVGLDTDQQRVESVSFGVVSMTGGLASGSVMIDDLMVVEAP